jgi:serine/threonine protein kinase
MVLREGDVLAGKYRVDRVLGAGGMGVVVAAQHLGLDTRVAVKLLLPEMLAHSDIVARFAREARAAAKITNEHVARVFDVGALENGSPYLVMEFLDGIDLQQWLERDGALGVAQAVDFVLQACEAVAEAHALGIVHRDLKPANLFCIKRGDAPYIKVLDFGISKVTATDTSLSSHLSMTRTSALMGTPFYMSPEQMESARDVDGRSDIWTFGVILFELISGQVPFGGTTLPEVCIKIATHPPPPIRSLKPEVPEGIQTAIVRCLEKDRNKRFATVGDFAEALAPFASPRSGDAGDRLKRSMLRTSAVAGSPAGRISLDAWKENQRPPGPETLGAVGNTWGKGIRRSAERKKVLIGLTAIAIAASIILVLFVVFARPANGPTPAIAVQSGPVKGTTPDAVPTPIALTPTTLTPPDAGDGSADYPQHELRVALTAATPAQATADGQRGDPRGTSKARRSGGSSAAPASTSKPVSAAQTSQPGTTLRPSPGSPEPATTPNAFDERL